MPGRLRRLTIETVLERGRYFFFAVEIINWHSLGIYLNSQGSVVAFEERRACCRMAIFRGIACGMMFSGWKST